MNRLIVAMTGAAWCLAVIGADTAQAAEKYPVKPIMTIVGIEAGGDGDVLVRQLMERVSKILGQNVVIVNKPGAGSSLSFRELNNARPDGYTLGWGSAPLVTNKLQGISPLDYRDFTPLGAYATFYYIVISSTKSKYQFNTIQEVIAHAKANPGQLSMATAGIGQGWWLAAMSFLSGTGITVNTIPQPGTAAMVVTAVAGGHADLGVLGLASAKGMIESGQVKFLASGGDGRAPAPYDKIPTVKELGYDASFESINIIMGPAKLPKDIVAVLTNAVEKAAKDPEFIKFVSERNARWGYIPPEKIIPELDRSRDKLRAIMGKAGILKEAK